MRNIAFQLERRILFGKLIAVILVHVSCIQVSAFAFAQDDVQDVREIFSDRNYPWYDSESDRLKDPDLSERQVASSVDRADVPVGSTQSNSNASRNRAGNNLAGISSAGTTGINLIFWFVFSLLILGLLVLLIRAFLRLERQTSIPIQPRSERSLLETVEQFPFEFERSTGDFRDMAQKAYQAGDYQHAIVYLFSHVLISLDSQGLIRLQKGKTNRQYLRELQATHSLSRYYRQVMAPFEAAFFGGHELTQADFEICWQDLDSFHSHIDRESKVAI